MSSIKQTCCDYDLIVVGAGLIGVAFALSMAKRSDFRILLVERSAQVIDNPIPNQRVLALGRHATDLLTEIGIFAELDKTRCYPYQRMFVWDSESDGELAFDAMDYQHDQLGYMVDAISLTILLQRALVEQPQISVHYELEIKTLSLNTDAAVLSTSLGDFNAPLIVAADGVQSWCRKQAKIFAHRQSYQQLGIVARIKTEFSHQDTAWQVFLRSGPLALLPLQDNQCSIVWSVERAMADDLMTLDDVAFANALQDAMQTRLGKVELLTPRQTFPLQSVKAESYFKHRLALIGDSAHSIHPLAGQGANLGFKDIAALTDSLQPLDPGRLGDLVVLQGYQRARKADNEQTDLLMTSLNQAYQFDSAWWSNLRGSGMNWLSRSPRVKALLARQAMGLL